MIFRFVSMRHGKPLSILAIVIGETLASLASSALLIKRDSLVFFNRFFSMYNIFSNKIEGKLEFVQFVNFEVNHHSILSLSQVNYA